MPSAELINLFHDCLTTSEAGILFQNRHDKYIYVVIIIKELKLCSL